MIDLQRTAGNRAASAAALQGPVVQREKGDEDDPYALGEKQKMHAFSQFKVLYDLGDGHLISVLKKEDDAALDNEVAALAAIRAQGLRAIDARVVHCTVVGKPVKGIHMTKVEGEFVDLAKVSSIPVIGKLLVKIARGEKVNTTEMGLALLEKANVQPPTTAQGKAKLGQIMSDLRALLNLRKTFVINDLQGIIDAYGKFHIIDPQWAGAPDKTATDAKFIQDTYDRLEKLMPSK